MVGVFCCADINYSAFGSGNLVEVEGIKNRKQYVAISETLKQTKANILKWPSQSPDMTPNDNMWWDLIHNVARRLSNLEQLERAMGQKRMGLDLSVILTLVVFVFCGRQQQQQQQQEEEEEE